MENFDILENLEDIKTLRIGNGLLLDIAYSEKIKTYTVEDDYNIQSKKAQWENKKQDLINNGYQSNTTEINLSSKRKEMNDAYLGYIDLLINKLKN